jgi:hypothetical protein
MTLSLQLPLDKAIRLYLMIMTVPILSKGTARLNPEATGHATCQTSLSGWIGDFCTLSLWYCGSCRIGTFTCFLGSLVRVTPIVHINAATFLTVHHSLTKLRQHNTEGHPGQTPSS